VERWENSFGQRTTRYGAHHGVDSQWYSSARAGSSPTRWVSEGGGKWEEEEGGDRTPRVRERRSDETEVREGNTYTSRIHRARFRYADHGEPGATGESQRPGRHGARFDPGFLGSAESITRRVHLFGRFNEKKRKKKGSKRGAIDNNKAML
ncbi:hypothetical protein ALC56_07490, partial [Trachymyrmex septentrionalis]